MRRLVILAAALALAACSSGGTSPRPPVATASAATGSLSPAAPATTPSPAAVSARVAFDGTSCDYTGPALIAVPAVLTIEFAPAEETYGLSLDMVLTSTTKADVDQANADETYGPGPGKVQPEFTIPGAINRVMGTMTFDTDLDITTSPRGTYDQLAITCIETPWAEGAPYDQPEGRHTGALVQLVGPQAAGSHASLAAAAVEPVLAHVTGTLEGGWHSPSPTEGCARTTTGAHAYMSCFGILSDPRVSGTFAIEATVGTPEAGYGVAEIWTEESRWQGSWFASEAWPQTAPGVGADESYGPTASELTMDWAWLEGEGENEGLTFVLSVENGAVDGWLYGSMQPGRNDG